LADLTHVAPHRAPIGENAALISYGADGLLLDAAGSTPAPRVIVTDTSYESLRLDIDLGESPPRVALGASIYGDGACPWPEGVGPLTLRRRERSVSLERAGKLTSCSIAEGAVSLALVAPESGHRRAP
jgi:hypothetical protein